MSSRAVRLAFDERGSTAGTCSGHRLASDLGHSENVVAIDFKSWQTVVGRSSSSIPRAAGGPRSRRFNETTATTLANLKPEALRNEAPLTLRAAVKPRFQRRDEHLGWRLASEAARRVSHFHYGFGGDVQISMTSDSLPVFSIPWTHHGGR